MLNYTVVTEYSFLFGTGRIRELRRLIRMHLFLTTLSAAAYVVVLLIVVDFAMRILTHGQIEVIYPFFGIMMAAVVAEMLWSSLFTPLSALNRHSSAAHLFLVTSIVGMLLCYPLTIFAGLSGAGVSVLFIHAVICVGLLLMIRQLFKSFGPASNKPKIADAGQ